MSKDVTVTKCELTIDEVRDHDTDGDHDLEETSDTPADVLGAALRHVGGRDGRDGTNTNTSDDTAGINVAQAARATSNGLQNLSRINQPPGEVASGEYDLRHRQRK